MNDNFAKDLSIIISLYNEEESLPELVTWITDVMQKEGYSYELIMVDDGSQDGSWKIIRELSQANPNIKGISFRRNYGKSAALYEGFKAAAAELNLNVTVILFQNGTLGMVRQQQKYLFDRNFSASEFGAKPDFSAIAQGFGIRTANADEDSQWYRNAFSAADGKNPCFVVVKTDPEEDVLPFVKPGHPNIESWN